jgi:hypothetical protein
MLGWLSDGTPCKNPGRMEIDERLLADLIRCVKTLDAAVGKLDPPKKN